MLATLISVTGFDIPTVGELTDCPGYLGISISDRLEMEEVFKYDALISCPPEFNITFNIPNWGVKVEKTFDIVLDDANRAYRIFLTNILFDDTASTCKKLADDTSDSYRSTLDIMFLGIFAIIVLSILAICFFVWIYAELCKKLVSEKLEADHNYSQAEIGQRHKNTRVPVCLQRFRRLSRMQKTIVILYLVFQLIYCLVMTFTVVSLLFALSIRAHANSFAKIGSVQLKFLNLTHESLAFLDKHALGEIKRQTNLLNNMQVTCDTYMEELAELLWTKLDRLFRLEKLAETLLNGDFWTSKAFRNFNETIARFHQDLDSFVRQYHLKKERTIRPVISQYRAYVQKILNSSWLMQPKSLFNKTSWWSVTDGATLHKNQHHTVHHPLKDELAFATFLNLPEVEEVNSWQSHFAQRY